MVGGIFTTLGGTRVAGGWQQTAEAIGGSWKVALQRSGDQVAGTIRLTGSTILKSGTVSGTIDGQNIILGVSTSSDGAAAATFSGLFDGEAVSGEWKCAVAKDEGVWHGTMRAKGAQDTGELGDDGGVRSAR